MVADRDAALSESAKQRKGVIIAVCGTLATTPDAVLLRWAQMSGAKLATILFWKLLIMAGILTTFARCYEQGKSYSALVANPGLSLAIGVSMAGRSVLLSYAFVYTFAATAVMLFSLHPLWSSVVGWIFLGDALPRRTVVALLLAVVALVVMFWPELSSGSFGSGMMSLGDGMALATSICMTIYLALARHASRKDPQLSVPTASGLGLLLGSVVILVADFATGSTVVAGFGAAPPIIATILDACAVGSVNIAHATAPKYTNATQIGLISLIEAVLSPVWVFVIFGETPDTYTIIGGAAIVIILAGHELFAGCGEQPKEADDDAASAKDEVAVNGSDVLPPCAVVTVDPDNALDVALLKDEDRDHDDK